MKKKERERKIVLLQKVNMTDLVLGVIPDSLRHMDEGTLFLFETNKENPGNVATIADIKENVVKKLREKGITAPFIVYDEIARVLNNSLRNGTSEIVIARDRLLKGVPLLAIKPSKLLLTYARKSRAN